MLSWRESRSRRILFEWELGMGHLCCVRSLRMILALVLAVAWMPLAAHCQIERVTGLEILKCTPLPGGEAPCSPGDAGSCCGWESGQYHLPAGQPQVTAPLVAVVPLVLVVESWMPTEGNGQRVTEAPPGPPKPWQFCLRAALPVRAPSIAS